MTVAAILWHCTQHGHSIACRPSNGMAIIIGLVCSLLFSTFVFVLLK